MRKEVLLAAIILVAISPGAAGKDSDTKTVVSLEGNAIVYRGRITADANKAVRELLTANKHVRELAISSEGGDVALGMDLGELVKSHRLDVRVTDKYCVSSCANYVFPAAARKFIDPGAVVVWHGSAIQQGLGNIKNIDFSQAEAHFGRKLSDQEKATFIKQAQASTMLDDMKERQAKFYADIGINDKVTVFGQEVNCDCNWTVPVADMEAFGIRNVEAPADYGTPASWWKDRDLKLLRLADYPEYAARLGK